MQLAEVLVSVLAVWRVTHLLHAEEGPWDIGVRLRRAAGEGFWGRLLDCFYCLSLWVSAPATALLAGGWAEAILLWLGLSGGAAAVERVMPSEARFEEDP